MKFLKKLLGDADVEWLPLGEMVDLKKGQQMNKELLTNEGLYPAYNGGISHSGFTNTYNYDENTIIVSQGGASAGFVNYVRSKFYANAHCYVVLPHIDILSNRYAYHFLKLNQNVLTGGQYGAGIPALKKDDILDLLIPIPYPGDAKASIDIQNEIVRILDTFTEITTELTTELTLREKQYMYYSNSLLKFSKEGIKPPLLKKILGYSDIAWLPLGEMIDIEKGKQMNKELLTNEGLYPAYNGGASHSGFVNTYNYNENTIIVSQGGASAGFVNFVKSKFYANAHCYVILPHAKKLSNRYAYHFLKLNQNVLTGGQYGAGIPALKKSNILDLSIPIPCPDNNKKSLNIQSDIVNILDKFDMLINSISDGLPREIELRQKQYEYYRALLFNFPKTKGATK